MQSTSVVMFRYLVSENGLKEPLEREGIKEEEMKLIESLMNPRADVALPEGKVITTFV